MMEHPVVRYLIDAGFPDGWAFNERDGIVVWERPEPQPTEAELIAAGWIKPESEQETPTE